MFGAIRKETNAVFAELIQGVNPFKPELIDTSAQEVIGLFEKDGIKIPILICYNKNGIYDKSGIGRGAVKITYKKAIVDGADVYAVAAIPEYFTTEKGVELILTKTLALFNLLSGVNNTPISAEASARAEVAAMISRALFMVNHYNSKEAKHNEKYTCAMARERHKAMKEATKNVAEVKAKNKKSGKPSLADISQQASQKLTDELLETEVPLATV